MKRFIFKTIGFLVAGFLILNLFGYLLINSDSMSQTLSWNAVLSAVKKSKRPLPSDSPVVILGDSVGNQFFLMPGTPNSLTANGSILTAGHYILAYNAIKRNKHLKYVVLLSVPFVIGHKFERSKTYNNFMKPFYSFENLRHISEGLREKINKKKTAHLAVFPFVKTAPCFSDVDLSGGIEKPKEILSETAIAYLEKLKTLCKKNDIDLIVASPPIRKSWRKKTKNWNQMKEQIKQNGFDDIFEGYFKRIIYLDEKCFRDRIHLSRGYLKKNRAGLIARMLPKKVSAYLLPPKNQGKKP